MEPRSFNGNIKDLIRVLRLPILAALLILGACSTPKPSPTVSATLTATPELTDAGIWRLAWETKNAREITLNGETVPAKGDRPVTREELGEYILKAGPEERKLTLGAIVITIEAVDDESGNLLVGDEITLRAVVTSPDSSKGVTPEPTVSWHPPDTDVVDVEPQDDGTITVTALTAGQVNIRATSRQDSEVGDEFPVTVTPAVEPPVDAEITISKSPGNDLLVGDTFQFAAELNPEDSGRTITWSASPEGSVTFDQGSDGLGKIRMHGTITVTAAAPGAKSDKVEFKVTEPTIDSFTAASPDSDSAPEACRDAAGETGAVWVVSWKVSNATEVLLNGAATNPEDCEAVLFPAEEREPRTYTLEAGGVRATPLTLAPLVVTVTSPDRIGIGSDAGAVLTAVVSSPGTDDGIAFSQGITWHSSDSTVVDVDPETRAVTGVGRGTATITATSQQDPQATGSRDLSVYAPEITSFSIVDPENTDTLRAGDSSITFVWEATDVTHVSIIQVDSDDPEDSAGTPIPMNGTDNDGNGSVTYTLPLNMPGAYYRLEALSLLDDSTLSRKLESEGPLRFLGWVCENPERVVTFEDSRVESEVRDRYDLDETAQIICSDVWDPLPSTIEEGHNPPELEGTNMLFLSSEGMAPISSLEGLQHLRGLRRLELEHNELTGADIANLASLTELRDLNLDNNLVDDLNALRSLTRLEVLGLYNNRVEDLGPLAGLKSLVIAYLSGNRIKDVEPLADLTNLEHLWLYQNCRNHDEDEDMWFDCLEDITALAELTSLKSLLLHNNEITSIPEGFFTGFNDLEFLMLSDNLLGNKAVVEIAQLTGLHSLQLASNLISDFSPVFDAPQSVLAPLGDPWQFRRANVIMPPNDATFWHLTLSWNCLDTADEGLTEYLDELSAAEYLVDVRTLIEDEDGERYPPQRNGPEDGCPPPSAGRPAPGMMTPQPTPRKVPHPDWLRNQLEMLQPDR